VKQELEIKYMTFPVLIEEYKGQFAASLVGVPKVRVVGQTRSQAIDALKAQIKQRIRLGELLSLEVDSVGISNLAGKYEKDPTLRDICDSVYQMRDAEREQ
jgi:hypothetical protein